MVGPVDAEPEGPDGPRIVPGPNSGVSKGVRCKCETMMREGRRGGRFLPPTAYDLLMFHKFSFWSCSEYVSREESFSNEL